MSEKYSVGDKATIVTQPENQIVKLVGDIVEILDLQDGYADVKSESGGMGSIPVSCLGEPIDTATPPQEKYGVGDKATIVTQPENQVVNLVGEMIEILEFQGGYAHVKSKSCGVGSVPVSCLERLEGQDPDPSRAYLIKQLQELALKENPVKKYEEKLCEFLEILKEGFPDVDGLIDPSGVPSPRIELILWPSNQVSEKNSILRLSFETGQAKYTGAGTFPFTCNTPEDLWNHLVSLISNPDFQQTLLRLKQRNKEAPT